MWQRDVASSTVAAAAAAAATPFLRFYLSLQLPGKFFIELELELIQTQMTQKPMLRAEVYARALRASQNRKEDSS